LKTCQLLAKIFFNLYYIVTNFKSNLNYITCLVKSMVDYPYALKTSTIEDFLKNMPNRPEPTTRVSKEYLKKLGYTSSNDFTLIAVLKFIGFLDNSGNITETFRHFRDTQRAPSVMAQALKSAYADLFNSFANPCKESLANYFRTATGRAGRTLEATEGTFKTLCKSADFGASEGTQISVPTGASQPIGGTPHIQLPAIPAGENGVNVTVNIRFELPATDKVEVYDKIFESLRRNIIKPSSKSD
jgi:hypothetical protein